MNGAAPDTREFVDAPIRRALDAIVLSGTLLFGLTTVMVFAAFVPEFHPIGHVLVFVIPGGYLAWRVVARLLAAPIDPSGAWSRAFAVDPGSARLAVLVVLAVPLGLFMAAGSLAIHHLGMPESAGFVYGVIGPAFILLWLAATAAWLDACRDRLARAALASEELFRSYWASIAQR